MRKKTKVIEINLVAKIQKHSKDPKFIKLGEKLQALRDKHEFVGEIMIILGSVLPNGGSDLTTYRFNGRVVEL